MVSFIKAPLTLLQKPVEIVRFDAVESSHMALGLAPEILDSVDVIFPVSKQFRVVDPQVVKVRHVERVVGLEGVGIDDGIRRDFLLDDRKKRLCFCVGDDGRKNPSMPL